MGGCGTAAPGTGMGSSTGSGSIAGSILMEGNTIVPAFRRLLLQRRGRQTSGLLACVSEWLWGGPTDAANTEVGMSRWMGGGPSLVLVLCTGTQWATTLRLFSSRELLWRGLCERVSLLAFDGRACFWRGPGSVGALHSQQTTQSHFHHLDLWTLYVRARAFLCCCHKLPVGEGERAEPGDGREPSSPRRLHHRPVFYPEGPMCGLARAAQKQR